MHYPLLFSVKKQVKGKYTYITPNIFCKETSKRPIYMRYPLRFL